jgi:hypothetical protein
MIESVQRESNGSLADVRRDQFAWNRLLAAAVDVLVEMPLWKLQRVGDEVVDFMYPNLGEGRSITLRAGIAYCFRAFHGIVRTLVEGAWLEHVRVLNRDRLGESADFAAFMFGSDRSNLDVYRGFLRDLQADRCFYCRSSLRGEGEVDHFVPWARYPLDLAHNFVLVHRGCNQRKSDHVAAEEHLSAWIERNQREGDSLVAFFDEAGLHHDLSRSMSITCWVYSQVADCGGVVWVEGDRLRPLSGSWRPLLNDI